MAEIGKFFTRFWHAILCVIFLLGTLSFGGSEPRPEPSLVSPDWNPWVHKHWIWEHDGTLESTRSYVNEFLSRDIPVGVSQIEPMWSTGHGNFETNENYEGLAGLVDEFHEKGIRTILWTTSMINVESDNYQYAKERGYLLSNGKTVNWWLGDGAFLDYTNPEAVGWWHTQLDVALDTGIDGWKVDGTDPYIMLLLPAFGKGGLVSWPQYKKLSYEDFFHYTRAHNNRGKDGVISARPVDDLLLKVGFVMPPSTTRDINFAGWVGDQYNDWGGLRHALTNLFASAKYNFVSCGSDIGGYRNTGTPYKDVFIRWAQLGAFCPVMENGGGGEHRPWMYDAQTTDIYRKFVYLHHELIPYIYSQAAYSYELELPMMRPQPGVYTYLLGDDILVAPFFEEGCEGGNSREIRFPQGKWIYLFDESKVYTKGTKSVDLPLEEFPVFIRKGAILPLDVVNGMNGHGSALSADFTTVAVYPETGKKIFGLYEETRDGTMLSYEKTADVLTVKSGETARALLFRIVGEKAPRSVSFANGETLPAAASMEELAALDAGYFTDGDGVLWIAAKNAVQGVELVVR